MTDKFQKYIYRFYNHNILNKHPIWSKQRANIQSKIEIQALKYKQTISKLVISFSSILLILFFSFHLLNKQRITTNPVAIIQNVDIYEQMDLYENFDLIANIDQYLEAKL